MRRCAGLMLAVLCLAPAARAPADITPAAAADRVLARVPVPDAQRRVGEVLLIQRGAADVVETRLDTTLLRRVVAEIGHKEAANWPAGTVGGVASARYVAALEQAVDTLAPRPPAGSRQRHARRAVRVFIAFALDDNSARVTIGRFAPAADGIERAPLTTLDLPPDYVRENMRLIAADSLHLEGAALDAALAPLTRLARPPATAAAEDR